MTRSGPIFFSFTNVDIDLSIANLSNSLPKTPPTKEEMPTTIIKIED